jgi:hypothetical protein
MTHKQFATLLGFAFVVTAVAMNFGWALLALIAGAGGFYVIWSILQGESIEQLLDRVRRVDPRQSDNSRSASPPSSPRPRVH